MAEDKNDAPAEGTTTEPVIQSDTVRRIQEDRDSRIKAIVAVLETLPTDKIYEVRQYVDKIKGEETAKKGRENPTQAK